MERINQYWKMNNHLKANYDLILEKAIPNKWDMVAIVWGREGSGKSTFSAQSCKYMNKKFNLDNVVFTYKQIEDGLENCPPETAIDVDEAINVANVASHASKISQAIISKLTQIRKKKLKVFLCFPYLWMLNRYFISRCLFSVYVYAKDFDKRGYFKFYNSNKTEQLYNYMKSTCRYNPKAALRIVKPDFEGHFEDYFPLDEKEYDEKKEKARVEAPTDEGTGNIWKLRHLKIGQRIMNEPKKPINMTEYCKISHVAKGYYYTLLKQFKNEIENKPNEQNINEEIEEVSEENE